MQDSRVSGNTVTVLTRIQSRDKVAHSDIIWCVRGQCALRESPLGTERKTQKENTQIVDRVADDSPASIRRQTVLETNIDRSLSTSGTFERSYVRSDQNNTRRGRVSRGVEFPSNA